MQTTTRITRNTETSLFLVTLLIWRTSPLRTNPPPRPPRPLRQPLRRLLLEPLPIRYRIRLDPSLRRLFLCADLLVNEEGEPSATEGGRVGVEAVGGEGGAEGSEEVVGKVCFVAQNQSLPLQKERKEKGRTVRNDSHGTSTSSGTGQLRLQSPRFFPRLAPYSLKRRMPNAERDEVVVVLFDEDRELVQLVGAGEGGGGEDGVSGVGDVLDGGEEGVDRVGFLLGMTFQTRQHNAEKSRERQEERRTCNFLFATPSTSVFVSLGTFVSVNKNLTSFTPLSTSKLPSRPFTALRNASAPPSAATVLSTPEGVPWMTFSERNDQALTVAAWAGSTAAVGDEEGRGRTPCV